jgi:tetratricopeptide (TPR) repeat protein
LTQVFPILRRVEAVAEAPRGDDAQLDPQELRRRLFEAVRELFVRLADRRRLVLVIDDLQWSDADSLALFAELVRGPDEPALLLLATVRSGGEESKPLLNGSVEIPLGRLEQAAAIDLATALLRRAKAPPRLSAEKIALEADGHPLFIDELVRHAVTGDHDGRIPPSLEVALRARIERLPVPARLVLELACLASGRLMQQTAAQAAGVGLGDLAGQVAALRAAHLARTTGMRGSDFVEPYHGRVRAAVLQTLSVETASSLHRRLAVALEMSGVPDPEALCLHWREAGQPAEAYRYAAVAADKAARALAFDRAVAFYEICLELYPDAPRELRVRLSDALVNAGRGGEAGRAFLAVASGAPAGDALELRRRAAEQLLRSGHLDEGLAAIQSVLETVGMHLPKSPRAALASLLIHRAKVRLRGLGYKERDASQLPANTMSLIDICSAVSAGLGVVDTIRGADFQARQLLLALRAGEPHRVLRALAMETAFVAVGGTKSRRRTARLLARARSLAERLGEPHGLALTAWAAGSAAFLAGGWSAAAQRLAEAETLFLDRCTGATWELDTTRFFSLWATFYLGDVADLGARVPLLQRESETRGDLYAVTNLRTTFRPFLALVSDRPDEARAEVDDALARWSRQGFHLQHLNGVCSHALADLACGDGAQAAERFDSVWPQIKRSLLLSVQQIRVRVEHLRGAAYLARGDLESAEKAARRLTKEHAGWATALAALLRAGITERRGDPTMAEAYACAASALDAADMRLYAAAAWARAGVVAGSESMQQRAAAAIAWLHGRGVVDPERFSRIFCP